MSFSAARKIANFTLTSHQTAIREQICIRPKEDSHLSVIGVMLARFKQKSFVERMNPTSYPVDNKAKLASLHFLDCVRDSTLCYFLAFPRQVGHVRELRPQGLLDEPTPKISVTCVSNFQYVSNAAIYQALVIREVVLGLEASISAQYKTEYLVPSLGE